MLVALVFVLARNIVKLVVERRRGLPFSRFRAKLVLALLGLTIVPSLLVLIVGGELIRSSTERWFSQPIDDVLSSATQIAGTTTASARHASPAMRRASRARFPRPPSSAVMPTPCAARSSRRSGRAAWAWSRSIVPAKRRRRPDVRRWWRRSRRDFLRGRSAHPPIGWPRGSPRCTGDPTTLEPLDGGGELVRAGAPVRDAGGTPSSAS